MKCLFTSFAYKLCCLSYYRFMVLMCSECHQSYGRYESENEVAHSCPTLCNPVDCSLPGSPVHWIFQAIVLEWIAISFSRESSQHRDWTRVFHIVDRRFTVWATREVHGRYMYCRYIFLVCVCVCALSCVWLCLTPPPGSSVHGIVQARILEQVAVSFSRGIFLTQGWNSRLLCLLP